MGQLVTLEERPPRKWSNHHTPLFCEPSLCSGATLVVAFLVRLGVCWNSRFRLCRKHPYRKWTAHQTSTRTIVNVAEEIIPVQKRHKCQQRNSTRCAKRTDCESRAETFHENLVQLYASAGFTMEALCATLKNEQARVIAYCVALVVRSPFRAKHHVVVQYMARWMKCPLPPPPKPPPTPLPHLNPLVAEPPPVARPLCRQHGWWKTRRTRKN